MAIGKESMGRIEEKEGEKREDGKEPGEPGDRTDLYLYLLEAAHLVRYNTRERKLAHTHR